MERIEPTEHVEHSHQRSPERVKRGSKETDAASHITPKAETISQQLETCTRRNLNCRVSEVDHGGIPQEHCVGLVRLMALKQGESQLLNAQLAFIKILAITRQTRTYIIEERHFCIWP